MNKILLINSWLCYDIYIQTGNFDIMFDVISRQALKFSYR